MKVPIGDRLIGVDSPCYIIAEAGVNHNGELDLAHRLIEAAAEAGADAIKFQSFAADSLIVRQAPKADYQLNTTDPAESQYQMLQKLELTPQNFSQLKAYADQLGLHFLSTPYDPRAADYLAGLGVPAIKIASLDVVNYPLLRHVAGLKLPIILSTGMATLGEVEQGVDTIRQAGQPDVILLHCITNYPIQAGEANLRVMNTLRQAFALPVGYSDHTEGLPVPLAAVALGAVVIEKHFTLDRSLPGPDHAASLEPAQLAELVRGIRLIEQAMGRPVKRPLPVELKNRQTMRRSLVAACPIPQGSRIEEAMLALKRPGTGLGAEWIPHIVGRQAREDIEPDTQLTLDKVI